MVKILKTKKVPDLAPEAPKEPFKCTACRLTGIDPITRQVCKVCDGTPERN